MSDSKVTFTVTVHDVDLATWAKVEDVTEAEAADEFALIASGHIADALHEKFEGITIWTTRDDGSLLFTERPGEWPE